VLITGAEGGIGRETARRAAAEGADIAAVGLDPTGLDSVIGEVRAMGRRAAARRADVSDAAALTGAVDGLVEELGSLRVVHANAGILHRPPRSPSSTWPNGTGSWPST
jgi:3-oxoacyl-[acyl-carrier protein] reductase